MKFFHDFKFSPAKDARDQFGLSRNRWGWVSRETMEISLTKEHVYN